MSWGVARIFQRGGGGSHWVKQYRHGVFATEYCRLFAYKRLTKGGGGARARVGHGCLRQSYYPFVLAVFVKLAPFYRKY